MKSSARSWLITTLVLAFVCIATGVIAVQDSADGALATYGKLAIACTLVAWLAAFLSGIRTVFAHRTSDVTGLLAQFEKEKQKRGD
ncbi:hypothetical protein COU78_06625 [Candidatus Peregrinibacteria bacterium CG10_big_fil_rev_8_21_14_0_10_49_24]|nr:MAG: hypothetical protein COV83_00060 [Candidatus Peregrinibacteria bacterium CG11_big_fil_rev_8_21_14_0_20_49_14]PIR50523.1 MAG: hypothetical protein COU78_06625 [Candidatus Peregrinibacteria bacterium CG10_big_fil_rev_8_21_14_0_10_49_24]PJA67812.1 MAG: hypothetical protein CO157_02230 [Candidatus Peregrinibacteria bacterium CG_4_9_14_3_um_filter_49_12]